MKLKGITDERAIEIRCPRCGKLMMYAAQNARGRLYPYCKGCKMNVIYDVKGAKSGGGRTCI
ncbi:MAG: hypothetical protein IJ740_06035 [Ruminococcus sp.]|nr:hypothetical protein [Ruminococcus sp.]